MTILDIYMMSCVRLHNVRLQSKDNRTKGYISLIHRIFMNTIIQEQRPILQSTRMPSSFLKHIHKLPIPYHCFYSVQNHFRNNQMENIDSDYNITSKTISNMPQHVHQPHSQSCQSVKHQNHSLRYKEATGNTPIYAIPPIAIPSHKWKNRKQNEKHGDSLDTCESQGLASSQRNQPRQSKIKVELCKNFVEKGYCPYENRCRFAHGIEELRAKDTHGNCELYRTRRCKVFYEKHQCKFGERCNFMHENRKINEIVSKNRRAVRQAIRINFSQIGLETYASRIHSSKLMGLLEEECQSDCNI